MASGRTVKVVFFLLLQLFAPLVHAITISQETRWGKTNSIKITVNANGESYNLLIGTVRCATLQIPGMEEINKFPRLPKQVNGKAPPCWITLDLVGRSEEQRTEIALRTDNMYLVGFKNKQGEWFELKPKAGTDPLIPGATVLTFGGSYADLTGDGGSRNLYKYVFGKRSFLDAIEKLSNYACGNVSEEELKEALVYIVVMVCEAARMDSIKNRINSNWGLGAKLDGELAKYTVNWNKLSYYVLCDAFESEWTNDQVKDLKKIKVTDVAKAKAIVSILLWPSNFNPKKVEESCKLRCNNM